MNDPKELAGKRSSLRLLGLVLAFFAIVLGSRPAFAAALAITPPSASVAPLGTQMFTASGGSGTGYTWSISTNNSGGNISAAGLYTAGATGGVVDQVEVTDSAANTATASVTVTGSVQVLPSAATVAAGATQMFLASGGTAPYTWAITTNGSGAMASITSAGLYTAGAMAGMDVVTATDSLGASGSSAVTVTVKKVGIGGSCMSSATCPTGATCVDDVCCSSACTGQCQACNAAGNVGTCVTITGPPVPPRSACSQSDTSNICTMMTCDGTSATACTSFVGKATTCGVASCIDQIGTPGAVCEGDGGCQAVAPKSCGAYACVSDQCASSCTDTSECSPGNYCNVKTGKCIVPPPVPDAGTGGPGSPTGPTVTGGCSLQGRPAGSRAAIGFMILVGLASLAGFRRRSKAASRHP
jgi:hypothetical protein